MKTLIPRVNVVGNSTSPTGPTLVLSSPLRLVDVASSHRGEGKEKNTEKYFFCFYSLVRKAAKSLSTNTSMQQQQQYPPQAPMPPGMVLSEQDFTLSDAHQQLLKKMKNIAIVQMICGFIAAVNVERVPRGYFRRFDVHRWRMGIVPPNVRRGAAADAEVVLVWMLRR